MIAIASALALAGSLAVCAALAPIVARAVRFDEGDRIRDMLIVAAAFGWVNAVAQSSIRTYRLAVHGGWWIDHQWWTVLPDIINALAATLVLVVVWVVRWRHHP